MEEAAAALLVAVFAVACPAVAAPIPLQEVHGGKMVVVGIDPWDSNAWSRVKHSPVGLEKGPTSGCYLDADEVPVTCSAHGVEFAFDKSGGVVYGLEVDPGTVLSLPKPVKTLYVAYVAVCWWRNGMPFKPVTIRVWDSEGHVRTVSMMLADWCASAFSPYTPVGGFEVVRCDDRIRVTEHVFTLDLLFIRIPLWTDWDWDYVGPSCGVWAFHLSASELGLDDVARLEFDYGGGHLYVLALTGTDRRPSEPVFYDVVGGPGCTDTNLGPAGMDGVGCCYWEGEWPSVQTTVFVDGVPLELPPADGPDAIPAGGKLIFLPRPARDVWLLYAATNWNLNGKGYGPLDLVLVDDSGRTVAVRVPLADWCASTDVPANHRVITFDARATPSGIQPIRCSVWAVELNAGKLGLPDIAAIYFPDTGRRKVWILGATIDGRPVPVTELAALDVHRPWDRVGAFYPGGEPLDGTYLLPKEFEVPAGNPLEAIAHRGGWRDLKPGEIVWIPAGDEEVPVKITGNAYEAVGTELRIPRWLHATAVYVLYVATDWSDAQGYPFSAIPVTVIYSDGSAYTSSVGILDWCAFDPNAYDATARRLAAACAEVPQHEAYWTYGEPLVYEIPAMVFPYRVTPSGAKDDKRPIAWLLKLVFPPDKVPTAVEFGYHPGHLWVLAVTVRAADGEYYALGPDGQVEKIASYEQDVEPTSPPTVAPLKVEGYVQGYRVNVTWVPLSTSVSISTPTVRTNWPLLDLGAMTVTVTVPAGTLTTDDEPNLPDFRNAPTFRNLGIEQVYASGDAFAAACLLYLYDELATRITRGTGVEVFRAEPAYVTVLTAWNADLTTPAKKLTDLGFELRIPEDYDDSTFTEYITYQPTLGLEAYGPPLEARAVQAILSEALPGLEETVLEVARGETTVSNGYATEVNSLDWNRVENGLLQALNRLGVPNAPTVAQEAVQAMRQLAEMENNPGSTLEPTAGTIDEPILNKCRGLTSVTNVPWSQPTAWTTTVYTLFPVPAKGAAITSDCFHATLSDNLYGALKEIAHFMLYHAIGETMIGFGLSELMSMIFSMPASSTTGIVLGSLLGDVVGAVVAPIFIAYLKGELFNDWSDWNAMKMFVYEVAGDSLLSFTLPIKYYAVTEGTSRARIISNIVPVAFSYLSNVCTGSQLP